MFFPYLGKQKATPIGMASYSKNDFYHDLTSSPNRLPMDNISL